MPTIEEINAELERIGGDREVLTVKRVETNHVVVGPPYSEQAIPKTMIEGNLSNLKKGDSIIVNLFAMTDGGPMKALKKKYYFPERKLGEVL